MAKKDRKKKTKPKYECLECGYIFRYQEYTPDGLPIMPACIKCGNLYLRWINYVLFEVKS